MPSYIVVTNALLTTDWRVYGPKFNPLIKKPVAWELLSKNKRNSKVLNKIIQLGMQVLYGQNF